MTSALRDKGGTSQWRKLRNAAEQRLKAEGHIVCWRCGKIITPDMRWCLGHVVDRALGGDDNELALEHEVCSRKSGWELGREIKAQRRSMIITAETGELFGSAW